MKFTKLFYVVISSILVIFFILISNVFSPSELTKGSSSGVTKIYFADHISSALQTVIDNFNEKYKGQIKVEVINLPFTKFSTNERKELLARYLRSKSERLDLFSVDQIWVPRFAKWGMNFDKYIPESERKELLKYAMNSCYFNDSLVAVPLYMDVALMYYRKDLIEKLPNSKEIIKKINNSITWKDFIALYKEMKHLENPFYVFQGDDYEGLICSFSELMSDEGVPFIKKGKLELNTPQAHRALNLLVNLVHKYHLSPEDVVHFKEDPSYAYYLKNDGVFLRGWPSFLKTEMQNKKYKDISKKIFRAPLPHFEGTKPVSVFGGWNLMVSRFSQKKDEVIKFIHYLISDEAQKILYEKGGYLPINNKIYSDSTIIKSYPQLKFYEKLMKHGVYRPFIENYTSISDVLSYYLNLAIRQKISVNDALKKATEKINSGSILLK